jgi:hypothetical protein
LIEVLDLSLEARADAVHDLAEAATGVGEVDLSSLLRPVREALADVT